MNKNILSLAMAALVLLAVLAYVSWWPFERLHPDKHALNSEHKVRFSAQRFIPLPQKLDLPEAKVALGKRLFHEPRLSQDDSISCAFCHDLSRDGTDQRSTSIGINNQTGSMNAPSVFNSRYNFSQFWDGRAATLAEQVVGPVHNPVEMGSNWATVTKKLKRDKHYQQAFDEIYTDGITADNIIDAIVTFELSLVTPDSRFDQFLRGNENSLNAEEKEGLHRFKHYGCATCHQGINIGGNMFQRLGGVRKVFDDEIPDKVDLGRFNVTGLQEDRHVFKVPSLRNVALTAPYFHDGSVKTLEQAVTIMGRSQLGRELTDEDVRYIIAFLNTLTGKWQGKLLQ
jgi:cytochrome c peroxidase